MIDRVVKASVELTRGNIEGSEECYNLCLFLSDTLRIINVDYMINVENGWITCFLYRNSYDEYKLIALLDEMFSNDLAVSDFELEIVSAEMI